MLFILRSIRCYLSQMLFFPNKIGYLLSPQGFRQIPFAQQRVGEVMDPSVGFPN